MNQYDIGDLVTLTGRFFSDAALTVPADPTGITLSIRNPVGALTTATYPATITKTGTGVYTYSLTPNMAGWYIINWAGTGTIVSVDQEAIFVRVGINLSPLYMPVEQLKNTLTLNGTTFVDPDLTLAIGAASRAIDSITGRRFWLDADANQIRYYTPRSYRLLQIDDLVTCTTVAIDRAGSGTFSETWTNGTDFVLEPFNAPVENPARPYETLRVRVLSGRWLPEWIEKSVKITGQFGWTDIPDDVTAATGILAAKLVKRSREAPFGIAQMGVDGSAVRIARMDPDVFTLLRDYNRHEMLV